jgi:ribosomal protein S16
MQDPPAVSLDKDKAKKWLADGAQPSDAVQRIFQWENVYDIDGAAK